MPALPSPENGEDAEGPFIKRAPVLVFIGLAVLAAVWSVPLPIAGIIQLMR